MKKQMPKVAFPHVGTMYIVWESLIKGLGGEVVVPPYTSKKTLSYGTKNSPEAICLPYKLILGNFIEAIQHGADTVVMISSPGICRLGEYGNNIQNALHDLGYDAKYIELSLYDGLKGLYDFVRTVAPNKSPIDYIKAIYIAIQKVFVLDRVERMLSFYRAREKKIRRR